jgi:Fe2+ transport system protein FeoA
MPQKQIGEYPKTLPDPEIKDGEGTAGLPVTRREKTIISITDFDTDRKGRIAFIRGDCRVVQRLADLGLTPGTTIAMTRKALLGGPVELSVRRTTLAIDSTIADNIFIELPAAGEP